MDSELIQTSRMPGSRLLRIDQSIHPLWENGARSWVKPALALMAVGFVLFGVGGLDLGPADARIGLAAREPFGPLGQVVGYWAWDLWPAQVLPSRIASLFEEGGQVTVLSVRVPAALAGIAIGLIVASRLIRVMGARAGLWFGLCWFGSLGLIDRSAQTGLGLITGLGTVAALDRLISGSSDLKAGCWAALAFLAGGWSPLAVIALAILVLGRRDAGFSVRLLIAPVLAAAAWSIWTLALATPEAWAAALALPLTQRPDWWLVPWIAFIGLPFSPLALLVLSRPLRQNWRGAGVTLMIGWMQVALASLIVGTIVPGLAQAARVPALVGVLLMAAAGVEAIWTRSLSTGARRGFLAVVVCLMAVWTVVLLYGGYLWTLVFAYYRPVGIVVIALGVAVLALAWSSLERSDTRRALVALGLLSVGLKLIHWGYYAPEWNYRHSQGPWGRAIGERLLPNWTLHVFHDWSNDLLFATERPVRQLRSPQHLAYPASPESKHVLLLESEFENWPKSAPPIFKVATLHDEDGRRRILARTKGILKSPAGHVLAQPEVPEPSTP